MSKYYVTTSIPYANAKPHLGHTMDALYADVLARYYRAKQLDVLLQVGLDENGQKIFQKACEEKKSVPEFLEKLRPNFIESFEKLNISYDIFTKTSDAKNHWPAAQEVWRRALAKGDIYKKTYKGCYCVGCESFKKQEELIDGKCPDHLTIPEEIEEENYFFNLKKYEKFLKEHFKKNPNFVYPESSYNEAMGMLQTGLEDVSISRPKSRLPWGVPVPGDEDHVMYVWFDALTNYLSGVGFPNDMEKFNKYWPTDMEIVGKDNNRWHTLLWPAMLKSADLQLPKKVLVHYYILGRGGVKMSKTIGNVVDPIEVMNQFGTDPFRYYLLSKIPMDKDGVFDLDHFKTVYQSDLGNALGNLLQRTLIMIERYKVDVGRSSCEMISVDKEIEELHFDQAIDKIWQVIREQNALIDQEKPWELAKTDKEKLKIVVDKIYNNLLNIAEALFPFMPETAEKMKSQLIELKPEPLFPRIDN